MARVEIFRGQARRRWTDEEKRRLVTETFVPGATVHGIARRHGISTSQLFTWRKQFRAELGSPMPTSAVPAFAAVAIAPSVPSLPVDGTVVASNAAASPGLIAIELPHGERVQISGMVDPVMVMATLQALVRR
jgi:transposase